MLKEGKIYLAKAENRELFLLPQMTNRHGLIAGATAVDSQKEKAVLEGSEDDEYYDDEDEEEGLSISQ